MILLQYLTPGFRQHLREHQAEVDLQLALFLDGVVAESSRPSRPTPNAGTDLSPPRLESILKFRRVRSLFRVPIYVHPTREKMELFRDVADAMATTVRSWGGQLWVAYLPAYDRYQSGGRSLHARAQVLQAFEELDIPVIDIDAHFRETGSPRALWSAPQSHYTSVGYAIVANALATAITATDEH